MCRPSPHTLRLGKVAGLSGIAVVVAPLFPLSLIVVALTVLNLEHVVFDLMAGLRPEDRSANDDAYFFVASLAGWTVIASPILALAYGFLAAQARKRVAQAAPSKADDEATGA